MTMTEQKLRWILTNGRGMRCVITEQPKTIGRAPSSDFVVDCTSVSRSHARVHFENGNGDGCVVIEDLSSRNGTFVDERRVSRASAHLGNVVRFGQVSFVIRPADYLDDESTESGLSHFRELSPAQSRVYHELLNGISEKDIAQKLQLSPHTVHNHVREIYAKFQVHSRAELMAQGYLDGTAHDTTDKPEE